MSNIHKSVYIHPSVVIGKNVKIGPHCSIGYEALQFSRDKNDVPQFEEHRGGVIIEDGVEIMAGAVIVRGLKQADNTIIGKNTKINNLVHVGHSCILGEGNLIAAGVTFGGSARIGRNNFFGLNCAINSGGIIIGDYNMIAMGSIVIRNIPNHEIWAGNPARKIKDNLMFKKELR